MNDDIDIEEGRRLEGNATAGVWVFVPDVSEFGDWGDSINALAGGLISIEGDDAALIVWLRNNAAAMFDAIETGRQWETIARRLAECLSHWYTEDTETGDAERWPEDDEALAAFRDVADRTPTPTDGA